eukprot:TRINITY_DN12504_c0_g1_i10.p2 TRINITY_DN12504_c0_g1~~TRINITY_DN12504_c0_g1_i10.p2  ORF type:complete len:457 (+),score=70.53 TRINITY_DN12504_c0_g1_i10:3348-4718(+)
MRFKRPSVIAFVALLLLICTIIALSSCFKRSSSPASWNSTRGRTLWDIQALPLSIIHSTYVVNPSGVQSNLRSTKRQLTIGIPTIDRATTGTSYLIQCLDSLFAHLDDKHRNDVLFVIFLADLEAVKRRKVADVLGLHYATRIRRDQLRLIEAPNDFYPSFVNVRGAFNDDEKRWRWRQKQCVDYSFMMSYAYRISPYYLQLEDDVTTVPGYIDAIFEFIEAQDKPWIMLEYSLLGFIGKLFHDESLPRLAWLFRAFYEDQPVDFLVRYFVALSGLKETRVIRQPTLFEHIGVQSSLEGKDQPIKDVMVSESSQLKRHHGDNPPAEVTSNMHKVSTFLPRNCYSHAPGAFWAFPPSRDNWLTVTFHQPQQLKRVLVETGNDRGKQGEKDILENGVLEAADEGQPSEFHPLATFAQGKAQYDFERNAQRVHALRIRVLKPLQTWLMVREVAVWSYDD